MKLPKLKSLFSHFRNDRPLAWAQLSHQKVRLAVAMGGIAFANVLIFIQLGFRALFSEGATVLPQSLTGDLFLLNPSAEFLGSNSFARIRLYQASTIKGVANAAPLYINNGTWAYSKDKISFNARVFAFNLSQKIFNIPELNQQAPKLNQPNIAILNHS